MTSRASFWPQTWQLSLHVVLALLCLRAVPAVSAIDTLVVLHTNDFHGYISPDGDRAAGLARIATYFNRERARRSKVLTLDAGDCVSGTPVSTLFQGRPIFTVMTAVGYDAVALGNHEFDYGWREILAYRDIADFPLLSANARGPAGELIADAPFTTLNLAEAVDDIDLIVSGHSHTVLDRRCHNAENQRNHHDAGQRRGDVRRGDRVRPCDR